MSLIKELEKTIEELDALKQAVKDVRRVANWGHLPSLLDRRLDDLFKLVK